MGKTPVQNPKKVPPIDPVSRGGGFLLLLTLTLSGCATMTSPAEHSPASPSPGNASSAYDHHAEATTLDAVLVNAIAQIGKSYRWGGENPRTGFDCSGLIQYVLGRAGVSIPRTSFAQAAALPTVRVGRIRPGDLVFFNTMGQPFSHVGIYIGGDRFVSALNRQQGVAVQSLRAPYWAQRLDGVRRPMPAELLAMRTP
ncbi:C40 family peptidase [Acidithiobacillus ferrianus]|uniref:NlpC/P60 family protein n=2 Tax=Acidithiobacillus ferrianus TaxID=2678518 RepID=A0A845UC72_9PROT|nr:NlpC/P60 family protein [Acidithiobacillus ferrianus]